jgi:hypothetical protein
MIRTFHMRWRAMFALVGALALAGTASCGGGSGEGVVGSGGTGISAGLALGTVNGFGSVIVDGVVYDDRGATVVKEVAPGQDALAEAKLGDRVSVDYETAGVAKRVRVDAALAGAVASAVSAGQFSMLGQTVMLNTNAASGPVTQFGNFAQASDIQVGQAVEVHGVLVPYGDGFALQATRIERLGAIPAYLRVTGQVSTVGAAGTSTFKMGDLTVDAAQAVLRPSGSKLAAGQTVTVLGLPADLTSPVSGTWRLRAAQVDLRELRGLELDTYVSGLISQLDVQARTLMLGGLRVDFANASVTPPTAALVNGKYARVQGRAAADGSLSASNLALRDESLDTEAELRGNILALDAAMQRFSVRGVRVDALGARVEGCPASGLANGLFVEVEGVLGSEGVVASTVHCEDEPSDATVEREGIASAVNLTGSTFSLVPEHGAAIIVKWNEATYFGEVTPASLAGKKVQVVGSFSGEMLVASKIKR